MPCLFLCVFTVRHKERKGEGEIGSEREGRAKERKRGGEGWQTNKQTNGQIDQTNRAIGKENNQKDRETDIEKNHNYKSTNPKNETF